MSLYRGHHNPLVVNPTRDLPKRVAIIGAGTIGPDIGYYLKSAIPELHLHLLDVNEKPLVAARERYQAYADKGVKRGKMSAELAAAVVQNVYTSTDYATITDCDWVIEAATEDLALKRRIFAQVEEVVSEQAIITSNSSSLPAKWMFSELKHPDRATVTHFFAPAWRNPIVEITAADQLAPEVLEYLRWAFCVTGKVPLVTADEICFMLDRIFDNWCNESALLLEQASAGQIDAVATESFVHAGPFFVLNMANGNPIITETNNLQAAEEGAHYAPAPIFESVERWHLDNRGQSLDTDAQTKASIQDRLRGVLYSQSVDVLDRHIGDPADLDLGCRLALGFKKGPLELMREADASEVTRVLERFSDERPGMPMPAKSIDDYNKFTRHILVDDIGDIKLITLRRPEAMNALHDELTDEILGQVKRFENDPGVAGFVITGYGPKAFCAGADIGRFPSMLGDSEASAQYARDCSRLLVHLDNMKKPVVAALNGLALGGGLELAMRCHALVAQPHASLQFPEITLGIVPGIGAMVVPYRRWPQAASVFHDMLLKAKRLKADEALQLGVIAHIADDYPALINSACDQVRALADNRALPAQGPIDIPQPKAEKAQSMHGQVLSEEVSAIMRDAVAQAAAAASFQEALEIGYRAFGASALSAAAAEGIASFGERRAPDFAKTG